MDLDITGKVAIITGGSDGIGKATAETLAKEGAKVCIAARTKSKLDEAAESIKRLTSGEVIGLQADVRDENSVKEMIDHVSRLWNRIDILVNNAGTSSAAKFEDMTDEQVTEDFTLKVFGAIYCTRYALPWLKRSKSGVIVNITTPGGKAPLGGTQPTALSRAAGISLTKAWSKEFAQYGIRVNTVCVGVFKSGQHRKRWEEAQAKEPSYTLDDHWRKVGAGVPLGRIGEAHEAGDVVAFLCSERASYVTGTAINVDGGVAPVV